VQVPDLIGVKDRKYLDRTGLQFHRSLVDIRALKKGGKYSIDRGSPAVFVIAIISALADGDRGGAVEFFQKVADKGICAERVWLVASILRAT
jgi:hypothetical protein